MSFQMYEESNIDFDELKARILSTNKRKVFGEVDE